MSRRKPAPAPPQPGATRSFTMKVICSDRGQHSPMVLHQLYDARGLELGHAVADVGGRNASPLSSWREDGTVHYQFKCRRCRRDVPMREETLLKILDGFSEIARTRHPVLDISAYNGR